MSQSGRIELFDQEGNRKYLNAQELERFKEAARREDDEIRSSCLLLYWTGCRISDALAVLDTHISFEDQTVVIETPKKKKMSFLTKP
mgnify:CR=1 FL=1